METGEAMTLIAEQAEHQGFLVRQTRTGTWRFQKDGNTLFAAPKQAADVLDVLRALISIGLDWPEG